MPIGYPLLHGECMGGGERAPVALCREPVYVATPVGAERSPLATSARRGSGDGGVNRKALGCAALKIPELAEGFSCPARARAGRRDAVGGSRLKDCP